jgi:membrane protein implicated in regulation of membrane protease activity
MLMEIIYQLGPWTWWVLGLGLLAAELIMPGVFLVWIGLAALVVGALSLVFWADAFWAWQLQMLLFAVLSITAALLGRKYVYHNRHASDEPFLNQRSAGLVGRTGVLGEPILEGRGRIRLDDTYWPVKGPDLPMGSRVKVIASDGQQLTVEPT